MITDEETSSKPARVAFTPEEFAKISEVRARLERWKSTAISCERFTALDAEFLLGVIDRLHG